MALNDKFAIQEINLNKTDFSYDIKPKELEVFGVLNVQSIQVTTIAKFFVINTFFRYSYA